jgi:poly-gamma-glutamate synthesis protein (capsule biosynthesis protein)
MNTITIGLVGDLLPTGNGFVGRDAAESAKLRAMLWQPLVGSHIIVGNLEAPVTAHRHAREEKAYNLSLSHAALSLFDRRFVLGLANNHVMDYGETGLRSTLAALRAAHIPFAGAGLSLEEARRPAFVVVENVRIAVLCAADARFCAATASSAGVCPALPDLLAEAVAAALQRAQLVIVSLHMGLEYNSVPSAEQVRVAHACIGAGARIVQFHHSHCLSGKAMANGGIILYGTGNYAFPKITWFTAPRSRIAAAWRISYDGSSSSLSDVELIPVVLNEQGVPRVPGAVRGERIQALYDRLSRRIEDPRRRAFWQIAGLFDPWFLLMNAVNYLALLRRRGPRHVMHQLLSGIRVQLSRR